MNDMTMFFLSFKASRKKAYAIKPTAAVLAPTGAGFQTNHQYDRSSESMN